ncbi:MULTISPECIES: coniferyl-alcohol dehydrogenase [unclassified Mycobacterium]|uniref:coniferyl-alcohol dehydrogenase n=1 Tax=unclassified Mycobacterium TaxID=2642494 RepID=UPI0029C6B9DC|nr:MULTISPECIES: coniferyl-alcohol dehydrogenase [unclassified Mycobacterium]
MTAEQRRIVVVGAASGIGAATATYFHERGDYVLGVDVRPRQTGVSDWIQCDLREPVEIKDLLARMGSGWDVLAHVAGVPGTLPAPDVVKINYLGMRLVIEGTLPLMRRGGAVVAVASTAAAGWEQNTTELAGLLEATDPATVDRWLADQDPAMAYYTSKQAVVSYVKRVCGSAWSKYGVRVNSVSPGPVETPILVDFEAHMGKEVLDGVRNTVGRHGTVDDIVPVIAFLGSSDAHWVNGQDIQVDGGFTVSLFNQPPIPV